MLLKVAGESEVVANKTNSRTELREFENLAGAIRIGN